MNDFGKVIKELVDSVSTVNHKFVYYEKDSGIIKEIANKKQDKDDLDCLPVEIDEVIDILNGKKSLLDFRVEYNFIQKCYQLIELKMLVETSVYLCKVTKKEVVGNKSFTLIKNNKDKNWSFSISDSLKQELKKKIIKKDQVKTFYIVEKGNPDAIIDTFQVSFENLIFKPSLTIDFSKTYSNIEIDILTHNYFSNYNLEVIDD